MVLMSLRNIDLAFGGPPLLEDVSLQIHQGERICLLGRNGAGKSSLLRLIAGGQTADSGIVDRRQNLRTSLLPQELPTGLRGPVIDIVAAGCGPRPESAPEEAWMLRQQAEDVLSRLELDPNAEAATLSGGLRRKVLLARALAARPDILLLDEPTNHLDIESINRLEKLLMREATTLVFVTHDRAFLRALANRIVEIDRGRLYDFACDYDTFLRRKEELLHGEAEQCRRFDKKLAEEEVWIRKGIKARRTRNEGRVRALQKMREERRARRERQGQVRLNMQEAERSGRLVAQVKNLLFGYENRPLIKDFSTTVLRGDRIGIIGPNGAGKTTLLKLLLGEIAPQAGRVKLGSNLQILYFDQLREQLELDKTVQQNLAGDQDMVMIGDQPRHVIGYLQDFLFTPERARSPVRILSGGERNRLLLARLFLRPANVLVMDEPTNDLDLETLDLLEERLSEYQGTLFLVSHDRDFLNRVVGSIIAFEPDGRIEEFVGGYDDYLRQRTAAEPATTTPPPPKKSRPARPRPRKLSFRERREFKDLPQRIEAMEAEQEALHQQLADPAFYKEKGDRVAAAKARLEQLEVDLEKAYERWGELEEINSRLEK